MCARRVDVCGGAPKLAMGPSCMCTLMVLLPEAVVAVAAAVHKWWRCFVSEPNTKGSIRLGVAGHIRAERNDSLGGWCRQGGPETGGV